MCVCVRAWNLGRGVPAQFHGDGDNGWHLSELVGCVPTDLFSVPLQVGNGYSDEAALILHRKGFDCRFPSRNTGLFCSTTQGKVSAVKVSPW